MFAFIIPFISKHLCRDWDLACILLSQVVESLYRQSDPHFTIIIVCNDKPQLRNKFDSRLQIVQADRPPPEVYESKLTSRDQRMKNRQGAALAMSQGASHFMLVDADDFLHIKLVAHVRAHSDLDGFYLDKGYEFDYPTDRIYRRSGLHGLCASTFIFNCKAFFSNPPQDQEFERHFRKNGHSTFLAMSQLMKKELVPIPFPAVMYTLNHGQNKSVLMGRRTAKRDMRQFLKYYVLGQRMNESLKRDFGMKE